MRVFWASVGSLLLVVACATGEGVDSEGFAGSAGASTGGSGGSNVSGGGGSWASGGSSSGGSGETGGTTSGGGSGGSGVGASGGSGGSGGGSGGVGASGGSGGVGGGTGGTGGSGGTGGTGGGSCGTPNTCASAIDLGTVSGDTGSGSQSYSDTGSAFMKIRVTEDNNSVLGAALKLSVSLAVPSGADYDLYAYVDTTSDVSACGTAPFKKSDSGGIGVNETVHLQWGEGTVANGVDDSRTVVLEVRYKAGVCAATDTWQLIAGGNK